MFFKPAIIALFLSSALVSGMLLYASYFGLKIVRFWDIHSGSELQLRLERRTYLISTIVAYAFVFQLFSLFLFIGTVEHLHVYFKGAMCAVGTLNVNPWGHPLVLLKLLNFLLAGVWLIVNLVDNQGYDYPLIRKKYLILLGITPLILLETIIQGNYFGGLKPEVITSCCGALFSSESEGIASEISGLPRLPTEIAFGACMAGVIITGVWFYRTQQGGYLFAGLSLLALLISLVSIISFVSIYIYELPTHHCPFCILQREYHYRGYFMYFLLLLGGITGIGAGTLTFFTDQKSLAENLPRIQRKLTLTALAAYLLFLMTVLSAIWFSNLKM